MTCPMSVVSLIAADILKGGNGDFDFLLRTFISGMGLWNISHITLYNAGRSPISRQT